MVYKFNIQVMVSLKKLIFSQLYNVRFYVCVIEFFRLRIKDMIIVAIWVRMTLSAK